MADTSSAGAPDAIRRAIAVISRHPAVSRVGDARPSAAAPGGFSVEAAFDVGLPNAWRRVGRSPGGVLAEEVARFDFPPDYPLGAPEVSLRPDFGRSLPHIQPWRTADGRVVPCLYDGDTAELLHQGGLAAVLNQTAEWLNRAAADALIDPAQGWEPARRDGVIDTVVADPLALRAMVTRRGGRAFLPFRYIRLAVRGESFVYGTVEARPLQVSAPKSVGLFAEEMVGASAAASVRGRSLALLVWPGRAPDGAPFVAGRYSPDEVATYAGLADRAREFGCGRELREAVAYLEACVQGKYCEGTFPLAVVLCARRSMPVTGAGGSDIELCPYVLELGVPAVLPAGPETRVRPASQRHAVGPALLRRLAGDEAADEPPRWVLLGCGSVGSKIAVHLARAGRGPEAVVDRAVMSPHNAARQALLPASDDPFGLSFFGCKADLLRATLAGLGCTARAVVADAADLIASPERRREAWGGRAWGVVNATASLRVREALAAADTKALPHRVVEVALFEAGRAGLLTVEGPGRNPNTLDLAAEAYVPHGGGAPCPLFRVGAGGGGTMAGGLRRVGTGEGCGSLTMPMSDARLSLHAAAMAEAVAALQRAGGMPDGAGSVMLGILGEDGIGLAWTRREVPPVAVVPAEGCDGGRGAWTVRVHRVALDRIRAEAARGAAAGVETGGILVGRASEVSHALNVVDALHAPEDSVRERGRFVLGTKGARAAVEAYAGLAGGALYCLGTWHSHLSAGGPSRLDEATARVVALARIAPSVLLIHTPAGLRALLADGTSTGSLKA